MSRMWTDADSSSSFLTVLFADPGRPSCDDECFAEETYVVSYGRAYIQGGGLLNGKIV